MAKSKPKHTKLGKQRRQNEVEEIQFLEKWIEFGKPASGSNPLSLPPLSKDSPVGKLVDDTFSRYAGCEFFNQMPLSRKTKDGLRNSKFLQMTDIQRASLPHSLCGRDILGAAQTGSGKTLAFVIPVSFSAFFHVFSIMNLIDFDEFCIIEAGLTKTRLRGELEIIEI